jgi:hypothetical protein
MAGRASLYAKNLAELEPARLAELLLRRPMGWFGE